MPLNDRILPTVGVAAVIGIALGVLIANGMLRGDAQSSAFDAPPPAVAAPAVIPEPPPAPAAPGPQILAVEKVISGEVVTLETLGPVRLLGIDTRQGPGGKPPNPDISKGLLERLVNSKRVLVEYDPATAISDFKDDAGLPLVYLTLDDGVQVNAELIARGGAVADLGRSYARLNDLVKAERAARWEGKGLWETARTLAPIPPSDLPSVRRPPAAPTPIPSDAVMVTSDGRFHRQSCRIGKRGIPMSPADARAKNYLACTECFVSPKVKI